jgi:viroplasmin and RNaseH domain-containing protein
MTYTGIHEDTDMTGLERVINWKGVDCSTPKQRDILLYEKKRSIKWSKTIYDIPQIIERSFLIQF